MRNPGPEPGVAQRNHSRNNSDLKSAPPEINIP